MLDRFILHVANAAALLSALLAVVVLVAGVLRSLSGSPATGDYVAAGALAVVPYCLAGTLHRIVSIGTDQRD